MAATDPMIQYFKLIKMKLLQIGPLKVIRVFIVSAGVLLLLTALAKMISVGGSARILDTPDRLFGIESRNLILLTGGIEAAVALACLIGDKTRWQVLWIASLSTCFLLYRLGILWLGYPEPCKCLGNLTDALKLSPQAVDLIMKMILAYLLVGSYGSLCWLWSRNQKLLVAA